jgi:DNA-binding HxlR family transcriptional regulator
MSYETHAHAGGIDSGMPVFGDADEIILSMQDIVGRKWQPIILYHLLDEGPLGFSALKDRIAGISSKMLSESLSDLENAALVTRTLLSDQPLRVEYSLTDRGASLEPLLAEMVAWGSEHDVAATEEPDEQPPRGVATVRAGTEGR